MKTRASSTAICARRPVSGWRGSRQHGEAMREERARWAAEGRCRGCGGRLERPGPSRQNLCRGKRGRDGQGERGRAAVEVRVRLPASPYRATLADAANRGESVEAWIAAQTRAP